MCVYACDICYNLEKSVYNNCPVFVSVCITKVVTLSSPKIVCSTDVTVVRNEQFGQKFFLRKYVGFFFLTSNGALPVVFTDCLIRRECQKKYIENNKKKKKSINPSDIIRIEYVLTVGAVNTDVQFST